MLKGISVSSFQNLLFLLSTFLIAGCSASNGPHPELLNHLTNQGPIRLSADNPYLAGNLFLSKEMESSSDLAGFIKHRGTPTALEINDGIIKGLSLSFYYTEDQQYFTLKPTKDSWVINGPFPITSDQRLLSPETMATKPNASLTSSAHARPNLLQLEKEQTRPQIALVTYSNDLDNSKESEHLNPNKSTTQQFESLLLPEAKTKPNGSDNKPSINKTVATNKSATIIAGILKSIHTSTAELTPKGDLVHHVLNPREDISTIVHWYTKDPANAAPVARINQLFLREPLKEGDTIIIPSYFVKNKKRLSEEAFELLMQRLEKEENPVASAI